MAGGHLRVTRQRAPFSCGGAWLAAALCVIASGAAAQTLPDAGTPVPAPGSGLSLGGAIGLDAGPETPAQILVVNQERLLSQSRYGMRIQREVEAAGIALAAENRRIEAALTEEELALTERRAQMTPDAFRPIARDFDARVNAIRAAQEAKSRLLQQQAEAAQARFFEIAFPILVEMVRARGAAVLMDGRAVLLSADGIDITDAAIARIDAGIGDGDDAPLIDIDLDTAPGTARPDDPDALPGQSGDTAP